jgi:hypothetical protein
MTWSSNARRVIELALRLTPVGARPDLAAPARSLRSR